MLLHSLIVEKEEERWRKMSTNTAIPPDTLNKWSQSAMYEITPITEDLFVSGISAINDTCLQDLGINLIVNATREIANFEAKDDQIQVLQVPVTDTVFSSLAPYFKVI